MTSVDLLECDVTSNDLLEEDDEDEERGHRGLSNADSTVDKI